MITRRSALVLLAATPLLSPAGRAWAATTPLGFKDLYVRDGELTSGTLALNGGEVAMRGFMAPPLKAEVPFFVLTRMPMSVCPFCETEADWPEDIVLVFAAGPVRPVAFNRPIEVKGRLDLGFEKDAATGFVSHVRLEEASFRTL